MRGGLETINLRNVYDDSSNEQQIKIQNKSILNDTQTFNVQNQNANYLIEYFEGMLLSYINMNESQGKGMDELKDFILSHDNRKITAGGKNPYIKNNYSHYKNDNTKEITILNDNDWRKIKIDIRVKWLAKYEIHITHDNNGLNKVNLIIDLQHNAIVDKANRLRNDDISTNIWN